MKSVLLTYLLLLTSITLSTAQTTPIDTTSGKPYYILLKDGSHIFGRIVSRDSTMLTVKMRSGQLTYVEHELFRAVSGIAPVERDSTVYYTNFSQPTSATTAPGTYLITLADGTVLRGQVLSQDTSRVVVKTRQLGTVYVPTAQVVRLENEHLARTRRSGSQHPSEGYKNLFPQYLNFTPTAFQAERGRVYYRNSFLYINQFDAGITDNWSVSGAVVPIFTVLAGWVGTKLSVPLGERARVGVQGQYFFGTLGFSSSNSGFSTSYLQGVLSVGTSQNNVTFGVGIPAGSGSGGQLLTVGVVRKVGPLLTFISENQLIVGTSGSGTFLKIGGGIRFDRRRHSFDVSGHLPVYFYRGNSIGFSGVTFTPWASYQVRLGK
jgi:hypothetical protein